jgi:hypothetical protein
MTETKPPHTTNELAHHKEARLELNILCSLCQVLSHTLSPTILRRRETGSPLAHHKTVAALQKSAEGGCHLCSRLAAFSQDEPAESMLAPTTLYALRILYTHTGKTYLKLELTELSEKLFLIPLLDGDISDLPRATLKHPKTDARPILALAKSWIDSCQSTHVKCSARDERLAHRSLFEPAGYNPTRLLQVSGSATTLIRARLVLGTELTKGVQYLTLSHCWGDADIIRLTIRSLEAFKTDIEIPQLPRNFQDALRITFELGFEYIWIDSLCIIQDSKADWHRQAELMGDIYRHSTCTIAAAAAENSHGGCFQERSALSFAACQVVPQHSEGDGIYIEEAIWPAQHLHTRAWVLQERCLSTRTLNFGKNQVYLDCNEGLCSESVPEFQPPRDQRNVKRYFHDLITCLTRDADYTDWSQIWWRLVEEYTKCNITYIEDKWKAIQGLANVIESSTGLKSLDGLWEGRLHYELLWRAVKRMPARLDIEVPSWSWLGINGPIEKLKYQPVPGSLSPASSFYVAPTVGTGGARALRISACCIPIQSDNRERFPFDGVLIPGFEFHHNESPVGFGQWVPDTLLDESRELWAMPVITYLPEGRETVMYAGLIILPVDVMMGQWSRIGVFNMHAANWDNATMAGCKKSMKIILL